MNQFRLRDWNDIKLLLACAEHGGFAGAAVALGIDQTTVSRRVAMLEAAVGRPLFSRRRSGASPTIAGLALLERARVTQAAIAEFEGALYGLGGLPPARVTLAASEGILTYTLIPVLLGKQGKAQPLSLDALRSPLPTLAFTTQSSRADIALMATGAGDLPPVAGAVKVRRVGTMHFKPVVGRRLIEGRASGVSSYDEFSRLPLLDIAIYRPLPSLAEWNDLVISRGADETVTSTPRRRSCTRLWWRVRAPVSCRPIPRSMTTRSSCWIFRRRPSPRRFGWSPTRTRCASRRCAISMTGWPACSRVRHGSGKRREMKE